MFTRSSVIGQHFAFAHGRTGVLQQFLLAQSDVDRMLGAHDSHEMQQVLTELRFTKLIDQSLRDENDILAACQAWVRREVTSMTPKGLQPVFDILWLDGDMPVLAYLLKQKKGLTSSISRLPNPPYFVYGTDALRALVDSDDAGELPGPLVAFVRDVHAQTSRDPRGIDTAVAQYAADAKLRLAAKSGSRAMTRYVRHYIDVQNIRTVLRFSAEDRASALPHLIDGGTMTPKSLVAKGSSLAVQVRNAEFYKLADSIDRSPEDSNDIERALNAILAEDVSVFWNTILSIESLFAFAITALAQIRLLRAIVIGKRNDLRPQDIKRMMPQFLSASHYVL